MSIKLDKKKSYGQFCPIARAAEVVAERWTPLILREMLFGSTTFSDLRQGIPLISPTTLSKRLTELQQAGILAKTSSGYFLTEAGRALEPLVMELGHWGLRYITDDLRNDELDPVLLMWDIRRNIRLEEVREFGANVVIQFSFRDVKPRKKYWWIVVSAGDVDLCLKDPGKECDVKIKTDLRTMTEIWTGKSSYAQFVGSQKFELVGRMELRRSVSSWLGVGVFGAIANQMGAQ